MQQPWVPKWRTAHHCPPPPYYEPLPAPRFTAIKPMRGHPRVRSSPRPNNMEMWWQWESTWVKSTFHCFVDDFYSSILILLLLPSPEESTRPRHVQHPPVIWLTAESHRWTSVEQTQQWRFVHVWWVCLIILLYPACSPLQCSPPLLFIELPPSWPKASLLPSHLCPPPPINPRLPIRVSEIIFVFLFASPLVLV